MMLNRTISAPKFRTFDRVHRATPPMHWTKCASTGIWNANTTALNHWFYANFLFVLYLSLALAEASRLSLHQMSSSVLLKYNILMEVLPNRICIVSFWQIQPHFLVPLNLHVIWRSFQCIIENAKHWCDAATSRQYTNAFVLLDYGQWRFSFGKWHLEIAKGRWRTNDMWW